MKIKDFQVLSSKMFMHVFETNTLAMFSRFQWYETLEIHLKQTYSKCKSK